MCFEISTKRADEAVIFADMPSYYLFGQEITESESNERIMLKETDNFIHAIELLPPRLRSRVSDYKHAEEIRIRTGRKVSIVLPDGEKRLSENALPSDINYILDSATKSSMHSSSESLKNGYITADGGNRIGLCGSAIIKNGVVSGLRNISSVCIRIAKEVYGISEPLIPELTDEHGPLSVLIISSPGGGKTTLLRDLTRAVSDRGYTVAIADERSEIAAMKDAYAQFDVGSTTDIMDSCPRSEAIAFMLRAMSPRVIVMDELYGEDDCNALISAIGCGASVFATAHASDKNDLLLRKSLVPLLQTGIFRKIVCIKKEKSGRSYQVESL